jgi:PQQ-dependent catabolism-associated beta-propeller protein
MVHFIDSVSHEITHNVLVDQRPRVAIYNHSGTHVWSSSEIGGTVNVIDANTHEIVKKITFKIPGVTQDTVQPVGIRLNKDDSKAFVALGPSNRVAVIDTKTYEVEKYLLVGQRVWNLDFTPDYKQIYTTNGTSNDVSIIDVESLKVIKTIPVGRYPWGVVIAKD